MKRRSLYDNAFIIAPRSKWEAFASYRREYPDANFSLHSQEDVESLFSYQYDDRAILFLLQEGYSYEESKDICQSLARLSGDSYEDKKLMELVKIRDSLSEKGLLWKQEYPERSLLNRCVVYHGYPDTTRVRKVFDHIGGNQMISAMQDFETKKKVSVAYHRFSGIYEELHYVFNRIAHLLEEGVSIDDIYLYGADETYAYLLPRMSEAYGFEVEVPYSRSLDTTPIGIAFLRGIREKELPIVLEELSSFEDDPNYSTLVDKVETFTLPTLSKEKQIALYQEVLRGERAKRKPKKNIVRLLKEPFAPENSHIFFLDFSLGKAPGRHGDEGYLSDAQKLALHQMSSQEEGAEEKANLKAFLSSGHMEAVCYHQIDLSGEKLVSPLTQEPLDPTDPDSLIKLDEDNDLPYEYSKAFLELELAHLKDLRFDYRQEDSRIREFEDLGLGQTNRWKGYDPQYQGFRSVSDDQLLKLSYSRVTTFFECPFHYYLESILGLSDDESTFEMRRGTVCHRVMEWMHEPDFEFEAAFQKALQENEKEEGAFSPKEKVFLEHSKFALKMAVDFLLAQERKMDHPVHRSEYDFPKIALDEHTLLRGKIDRISETGQDHEFLSVADYKTGARSFDPKKLPYGIGMQLPTYALALKEDKEYQDKKIIGLFISPIGLGSLTYDTSARKKGAKDWAEYSSCAFQWKGACTSEQSELETLIGQSDVQTLLGGGQIRYSEEDLNNWVETVKGKYLEASQKIREGRFPIHPIKAGMGDDGCSYCRFRDVCYLRESMCNYVSFDDEEEE